MTSSFTHLLVAYWPVALGGWALAHWWGRVGWAQLWLGGVSLCFLHGLEPSLPFRCLLSLGLAYGVGQLLCVSHGCARRSLVLGAGMVGTVGVWWEPSPLVAWVGLILVLKIGFYFWHCYRGWLPVTSPLRFFLTFAFFPLIFLPGLPSDFRDLSPQWTRPWTGDGLPWSLLFGACGLGVAGLPGGMGPATLLLALGVARSFGLQFRFLPLPLSLARGPASAVTAAMAFALALVGGQ